MDQERKGEGRAAPERAAERRDRLAAAMRENLKRRKEQQRGRQEAAEPSAGRAQGVEEG